MDVKFLTFIGKQGEKIRRFQYTAIDNGHEFQTKFHWYVEDQGIRHAYIKRGTPQLNGKVERSHRSDGQEFYQLLNYEQKMHRLSASLFMACVSRNGTEQGSER